MHRQSGWVCLLAGGLLIVAGCNGPVAPVGFDLDSGQPAEPVSAERLEAIARLLEKQQRLRHAERLQSLAAAMKETRGAASRKVQIAHDRTSSSAPARSQHGVAEDAADQRLPGTQPVQHARTDAGGWKVDRSTAALFVEESARDTTGDGTAQPPDTSPPVPDEDRPEASRRLTAHPVQDSRSQLLQASRSGGPPGEPSVDDVEPAPFPELDRFATTAQSLKDAGEPKKGEDPTRAIETADTQVPEHRTPRRSSRSAPLERLRDSDPDKRALAALILAEKNSPDGKVLAALYDQLDREPNRMTRVFLTYAILQLDPSDQETLERLIELSAVDSPELRHLATCVLGLSASAAPARVAARLAETLDDPHPRVRAMAALSLADCREAARAVLPKLRSLSERDTDAAVRDAAGTALACFRRSAVQNGFPLARGE